VNLSAVDDRSLYPNGFRFRIHLAIELDEVDYHVVQAMMQPIKTGTANLNKLQDRIQRYLARILEEQGDPYPWNDASREALEAIIFPKKKESEQR
jgi:two-component SAPR family response regulator